MTKYMKVTMTNGESPYLDLYKLNNVEEGNCLVQLHHRPGDEDRAFYGLSLDRGDIEISGSERGQWGVHLFYASFSAPGRGHWEPYLVYGTAKEFLSHIEEQQQRARRGEEIEAYDPEAKLYTEYGSVHSLSSCFTCDGRPSPETRHAKFILNKNIDENLKTLVGVLREEALKAHSGALETHSVRVQQQKDRNAQDPTIRMLDGNSWVVEGDPKSVLDFGQSIYGYESPPTTPTSREECWQSFFSPAERAVLKARFTSVIDALGEVKDTISCEEYEVLTDIFYRSLPEDGKRIEVR